MTHDPAEWQRVSFAADCTYSPGWEPDPDEQDPEPGDLCSLCGKDYGDTCTCPGPTQDGYEYEEQGGELMARRIPGYTE